MSDRVVQSSVLQVVVDPSGAKTGAAEVERAIGQMSNSSVSFLERMNRGFDSLTSFINKAASSLGVFLSVAAGAYAIKSMIDRLIEVNLVYNQFIATLTLVKGNAQAANVEFQYLAAYSDKVGASVEEATKVYGRLAAALKEFDKSGEATRHIFESIGQAQAVLHSRGYEVNGIFLALEQIVSKGKVSLEELQKQLGNRLPDAMGTTARAMDVTQAQLRVAITKGAIDPLELVIKLANQIKKEYGEAALGAAELFNAQINRMKNAVFGLYLAVGQTGALDGLSNILKAITSTLQDPNVGTQFGKSLGEFFSQIAKWISNITASDIKDFFDSLGVTIKVFTELLKDLVLAFASTDEKGKSSIIDLADGVTSIFIILTDLVLTFTAGLLSIPVALNAMVLDVRVIAKKAEVGVRGGGNGRAEELAYLEAENAKAIKLSETLDSILFGSDDSPTFKAYKKKDELFNKLRANSSNQSRASFSDAGFAEKQSLGGVLSDEKIKELAASGPGAPVPTGKGSGKGRDIFNSESTNLTKLASVALLEYNNLLDNKVKSENTNLIAVNAKIATDKNYIALSTTQKNQLRELAKLADDAQLKEKSAEAFSRTRLELNKQIYASQETLIDVEQQRDVLATKNQRSLEEKFKFDSLFIAMSKEMKDTLLDQAKALDLLAVSIRNTQVIEQSRYATLVDTLNTQRELNNASQGLGNNKYNEKNKVSDSFLTGGSNQFADQATQSKLLADAVKRDTNSMIRDMNAFKFSQDEVIRNYEFEASNIGKTRIEIEKATNQKKIYDNFRLAGIDLYKQENAEIKAYADNLVKNMNGALDKVNERQNDWLLGAKAGIASYVDSTQAAARDVAEAFSKAFTGLEDLLTKFITTGKFKFKDFANSVIKDAAQILVKTNVTGPLANSLLSSLGSGGSSIAQGVSSVTSAAGGLTSIVSSIGSFFGSGSAAASGSGFLGSLLGGLNGAGVGSGLTSSLGLSIGNSIGSVLGPSLSGALSTGLGAVATAIPYVAAAAAVYAIGKSVFGHKAREITGTTINGTLGTDNITRDDAYIRKGGFLSKDKTGVFSYNLATSATVADGKTYYDTARKDENVALLKSLNDAYAQIKTSSADYAKALGIDASSIADRTDSINYKVGKTEQETQANLSKAFGDVSNTIADSLLIGLEDLKKSGETSSQSLVRLATDLTGVNETFKNLGFSLYDLNATGTKAAESLISAFGDLNTLVSASKSYYDNFYTNAEKLTVKNKALAEAFKSLGIAVPDSRESFRVLVEAAEKAGDQKTYANLVKLSAQFADAVPAALKETSTAAFSFANSIQDTANSVSKAKQQAADSLNQAVGNAYNDQEKALKDSIAAREAEIASIEKFRRTIFGGANSPLSSNDKYYSAKSALSGANADNVQELTTNFLDAAKIASRSSDDYNKSLSFANGILGKIQGDSFAGIQGDKSNLEGLPERFRNFLDAARAAQNGTLDQYINEKYGIVPATSEPTIPVVTENVRHSNDQGSELIAEIKVLQDITRKVADTNTIMSDKAESNQPTLVEMVNS